MAEVISWLLCFVADCQSSLSLHQARTIRGLTLLGHWKCYKQCSEAMYKTSSSCIVYRLYLYHGLAFGARATKCSVEAEEETRKAKKEKAAACSTPNT